MLFKETSLDPSVAVSLEKHLFSKWSGKPGKYYTALPKLNMYIYKQVFGANVLTNAKQIFQLSCALKYLSKKILFVSIRSVLSEKRLSSRSEIRILACEAGFRRGGKGERRAREAQEDRTRDDRGRVPFPSRAHFDFPPSLSTACHTGNSSLGTLC